MKNNVLKSIDPSLILVTVATISTGVVQMHLFRGESLSFWTGFLWILAVTLLAAPLMIDMEVDIPTALTRYAAFALMLAVLKVMQVFNVHDVALATAILLVWRWVDVGLMWLNWKRCHATS
jgi:hypothetical protein